MLRVLRRPGAAFISMGGQAASSFLLTIVVSRAVDPSLRGEFVLLTQIPQIGAYLVTLGLPGAIMRAAAARPEQRAPLLGLAALASCAAGVALTALTPLVMGLAHSTAPPVLIVLAGTTALVWLVMASWFAYGCERFMLAGALRTLPILGAVPVIAGLSATGLSDLTALFAPWAGIHALVAAASGARLLRAHGISLPTSAQASEWIGFGARYSTVQLFNLVALRADQLILAWLGTTAAVGVYSVAVSLSEGILLAATAVGLIVFLDSAKDSARASFQRRLILTVLLTCAATGLLALLAPPLVEVVFGERYGHAASLTRILAIGTPGLVTLRLVTDRLSGANRPGTASMNALLVFLVTTGLDLALIPRHGAAGAAWASAIGYNVGGASALGTMRWIVSSSDPRRSATRAAASLGSLGAEELTATADRRVTP